MSNHYSKVPRIRVPYVSRLPQFDALEIHYDDEHRKYHICGGNYDPETGKLNYFQIDRTLNYVSITSARMALKLRVLCVDNVPIRWSPEQTIL